LLVIIVYVFSYFSFLFFSFYEKEFVSFIRKHDKTHLIFFFRKLILKNFNHISLECVFVNRARFEKEKKI
jgi:hypothetical protein